LSDRKSQERRLTAEIVERMRELARLRNQEAQEPFVPGESPVRYAGRVYGEEEMANLAEASAEFWLTAGRWHRRLETELAEWYGVRYARLVNSGSSANLLAVAALSSHLLGDRRLQPGDEVITVAAGFPTTVAPMIQHGLVPVFVDVDLHTCNADVSQLEVARSPRTRAVMMAHTLGNPFDLAAVKAFCERHDLWLVEDNCDAAGSTFQGKKTGTFGHLATLSFYPPHHMTTGEGGAVLTGDEQLLRAVESLRDWGRDCWCQSGVDNTCGKRFGWQLGELPSGYDHKYVYSHLGYNLKMTDLQAAVGVAQLARLDGFVEARRKNWAFYREALEDLKDVLVLPEPTAGSKPSWFGFLMSVRPSAPFTRDDLVRRLEERKIQTRMLFAGNLARQPALTTLSSQSREVGEKLPFRVVGDLASTDAVMNRSVWVGVYPGLTEPMRRFVAETIQECAGRKGRTGPVPGDRT
jgi:CDP-6-deoxy-D-xylo-4-hexulose-3-dehydrase